MQTMIQEFYKYLKSSYIIRNHIRDIIHEEKLHQIELDSYRFEIDYVKRKIIIFLKKAENDHFHLTLQEFNSVMNVLDNHNFK